MYAPSEPNPYLKAWKCIECRLLKRVSMFLKWTTTLSPTRARIVGPGIPSLSPITYGRFGVRSPQLRVKRLKRTVCIVVSSAGKVMPLSGSRPVGITFQVAGTAPIQ